MVRQATHALRYQRCPGVQHPPGKAPAALSSRKQLSRQKWLEPLGALLTSASSDWAHTTPSNTHSCFSREVLGVISSCCAQKSPAPAQQSQSASRCIAS